MPKKGFEKIWSAKGWTAGSVISDTLRRRNVVSSYLARFKYGVTIAGGTGAGAPRTDFAFAIADRIQVLVSQRPVQVFAGVDAQILESLFSANGKRVQTVPADDTVGDKTGLISEIPILLYMPHSFTPDEYAMPSALLDAPTLQIDMIPDAKYLFTAARDLTSAVVDAGATMDLYEQPLFDTGVAPQDHEALRIAGYSQAITQSGKITMTLDRFRPGDEIRAIILKGWTGGASGRDYVLSDALATDVRLVLNGIPRPETTEWGVLQGNNIGDYQLPAKITGVAVIDAGADQRTHQGELFTLQTVEKPYLEITCAKQAGDNKLDALILWARRTGD